MGIDIDHYIRAVSSTDLGGFKSEHGDAFLVRSTTDGEMDREEPAEAQTTPGRSHPTALVLPSIKSDTEPAKSRYYVYPVRATRSSSTEITVGRVPAMDVCVPDRSISRLHAVFAPLGDGRYRLEDKDSRNGTFIARKQLEPGRPMIVRSGQTVQFGNIVLAFFQAGQFVEFLYKTRDG